MITEYLTEKQYYNFVGGIAILNDCKLINIDYANRVIHMYGSDKDIRKCANELVQLLGRSDE